MRLAVAVLAIGVCALALGQDLKAIRLGDPQFVDKKVDQVYWAPDGKTLAYTATRADGKWLGVYDLDTGEGKPVLKIQDGDEFDSLDWLNVSKKALLIVHNPKAGNTYSATVLDAHAGTAHQVWTRQFKPEDLAEIQVDVSPILAHALVTITAGKTTETWVLIQGGGALLFSRDIAAAQAQGQSFAGWSEAGTAVFGALNANGGALTFRADGLKGDLLNRDTAIEVTGKAVGQSVSEPATFVIAPKGQNGEVNVGNVINLTLSKLVFRMVPSIDKGASCLECVPSNGVLRPVRFPGYFEEKPGPSVVPDLQPKPTLLKIGRTETGTQALWLVPGTTEPAPATDVQPSPSKPVEPAGGVLVSAQADAWWPAPETRAVAFVWNGALFVRTVQYPKS